MPASRAAWLLAGLGVAGLDVAAAARAGAAACTLHVEPTRGAGVTLELPLPPAREFTLSYLHSVTRTWVHETLQADGGGLVQRRIAWSVPGPGLPTEALPGERFERTADGFVIDGMQRRIERLAMRVDPQQQQTLEVAGHRHPLATAGPAALVLEARGCD